jgi:nucleoside-diphosphate-sugar epimerase
MWARSDLGGDLAHRAHLGWQPEIDFAEGLAELRQRMLAGLA